MKKKTKDKKQKGRGTTSITKREEYMKRMNKL